MPKKDSPYSRKYHQIEVNDKDLDKKLEKAHKEWDGKVWKGFTGPPNYTKYWLFVFFDDDDDDDIKKGDSKTFKICKIKEWKVAKDKIKKSEYTEGRGFDFTVSF